MLELRGKGHVTGECTRESEEDRKRLAFKPASRYARAKEKTTVGVVNATIGEYTDDERGEPVPNDTSVFAFRSLSVLMSRFSRDMVLFDNQAGDDVFRDRDLGRSHR